MEPRLSSSQKWTALPKEFLTQVRSVFQENFAAQLAGSKVDAEGRIYPSEILISVGIRTGSALKQSNFEVSIDYKKEKDNVLKMLHLGVDVVAALFNELFTTDDDSEFPRLWEQLEFEGRKVYVQYSTTNRSLEKEADKLLGVNDPELAGGEWDGDIDPDQIKAQLGLVDDEEDADEEETPAPKKKH